MKKWMYQQLHPDRMDENPVLEARLQALESLRMTPLETVQHYPSQGMIRAIAQGKQPLPDDLLLRASVERFLVRYKTKIAQASNAPIPPGPSPEIWNRFGRWRTFSLQRELEIVRYGEWREKA